MTNYYDSISAAGEVDSVAVNMLAGHTYQVRVQAAAGSTLDPEISQVLDPSQAVVAGVANADYGIGHNARVTFTPAADGQYGIGIKGQNGTAGNYVVTVADVSAPAAPDDATLTLTAGQVCSGSILDDFGTRSISFQLTADHEYLFTLQAATSGDALNVPVLQGIYDAATAKPLMGSSGQAPGGNTLSVSVTPMTSGTYYAVIADDFDDIGGFRFQFSDAASAAGSSQSVLGDGGDNFVTTDAGDDAINGGAGNDVIDGGAGSDTAVYAGNRAAYALKIQNGVLSVADSDSSRDGSDTVSNVEHLQFADVTVDLTVQAKAASISRNELNSIVELYVAYFNRVPDAGGLAYWIDQYKGGMSLDQIAQSFYDAGVAYSSVTGYSATMPSSDFIRLIYQNVLGRSGATAPSDSDVAYWVNQLNTGAYTKGTLVKKMLSDAHTFANDATWGWVPSLLDNKVTVGYTFAVEDGLGYVDANQAITQGMAIAHAVTPTSTSAAIALIGITDAPLTT